MTTAALQSLTANTGTSRRVFVSYATCDKAEADRIVAELESKRVSCWIAPRDIPPGAEWPVAIAEAIRRCGCLLLVFSADSDESDAVLKELTLAESEKKPIFPVRIRNDEPRKLAFPLAGVQWFDAAGGSISHDQAKRLVPSLERYLEDSPVRAWLHRCFLFGAIALLMTFALQLFFYATGTSLLTGASLWFVMGVCGLLASGSWYVWRTIRRQREGS